MVDRSNAVLLNLSSHAILVLRVIVVVPNESVNVPKPTHEHTTSSNEQINKYLSLYCIVFIVKQIFYYYFYVSACVIRYIRTTFLPFDFSFFSRQI